MEFTGILLSCIFVAGCVRIGQAIRHTRGTTLRAPSVWVAIMWCVLAWVEYITWNDGRLVAAKLRYLAAVGTYCPAMALWGAKRPQDRGWQFIVATLWLILGLPALQSLALAPTAAWQVHPAFTILLVLLTVMQVSNYLPTRYWLSAILGGCAQGAFFWRAAVVSSSQAGIVPWSLAFACLLLARRARHVPTETGWNVVWRDFRNAYGCVWGLRVMERVNQAITPSSPARRLEWFGFRKALAESPERLSPETDDGTNSRIDAAQETALRSILRRFVSDDWITTRLGDHASTGPRS